jgi:hypothetical protein
LVPAAFEAVRVSIAVEEGVIITLPLEFTGPRPVILTAEALRTLQLNAVELPAAMADGLAANEIMLGTLPT